MNPPVELAPESLEALAERIATLVADYLADRMADIGVQQTEPLIDATEAARRLGVDRGTVYRRADELGAIRLGDGAGARLRFDPSTLVERFAAADGEVRAHAQPKPPPPARPRPTPHPVELLPIHDDNGGTS